MMRRFEKDRKIYYREGYVIVKNFIKHQEINSKVRIGIDNEVSKLPYKIRKIVSHSLSYLNLTESNLILTESNPKKEKGEASNEAKTQWGKRGGIQSITDNLTGR